MSHNSSYTNGLSVQATPTRDRDRLPFPQSAHPSPAPSLRHTANSSASNSLSNLSSSSAPPPVQASPQPISVDALLRQFSSSPDPKAAALDQAVGERNVLSAQNSQLWKLIEKQRAGYNQILKELERIRGERDSYKSRLAALNGNIPSDKRHRNPSERSRPSLDTTSSHSSSSPSVAPLQIKASSSARNNSDDTPTQQRSLSQPAALPSSRSLESLSDKPTESELQSNANYPVITTIRTSSPPPAPPSSAPSALHSSSRQSRPSPSPLVVPNRADTFPASYTISTSPESTTSTKQPAFQDANTLTNNAPVNGIYTSEPTRPLVPPRKSSISDSISSSIISASSAASLSSTSASGPFGLPKPPFGGDPSTPSQQQYQARVSPQTTPLALEGVVPRPRNLNPSLSSLSNSQPSPLSTTPINASLATPKQTQTQSHLLSPMPDNRSYLSRDSRISLPDEARQYMLNMTDSPAGSPRADTFSPRSKLSTSVFPPTSNSNGNGGGNQAGRESEFLDMEEEEDDDGESEDDEQGETAGAAAASDPGLNGLKSGNAPTPYGQGQGYNNNNNTNNTNEFSGNVRPDNQNNYPPNYHPDDAMKRTRDKSRVGAEEFPLPPPSNIVLQRQQALAAQQEMQAQAYLQSAQQQQQQQQVPPPMQQQQQQQQPSSLAPASSSKQLQAMSDQPYQGSSSSGSYIPPHESQLSMPDSAFSDSQSTIYRSDSNFPSQQPERQESPSSSSFIATTTTTTTTIPSIPQSSFRALPLLSSDLPQTNIVVSHSFVRPNDRGKEVLSFIVFVNPGNGKDGWKVEKMYSDVLSLDQRVRNSVGKGVGKKIANLPEGKLWKDHAPAKVDQRKAVLENYLQTLIQLPVKNNDEVIAFFTSDIVREQKAPVMQVGHKEGYLTKRGKNFGGWKTRFFVLQGPVLEYYECRGGAHLGSITITGAQIARQHRTERPPTTDDEKEYRHAFLIVEAKKGPGGNHPRHVLCAESDEERDSWVEMLVRYYTGTYSEDLIFNPSSGLTSVQTNSVAASQGAIGMSQPRSSSSSSSDLSATPRSKPASRGMSREDVSRGPVSYMPPDVNNGKPFQSAPASAEDYLRSSSPSRSLDPSPIDRQGPSPITGFDPQKRMMERSNLGLPSSLSDSSPLSIAVQSSQSSSDAANIGQRANSELGHYPDLQDNRVVGQKNHRQHSPEQHRTRDDGGRKSFHPSLNTVVSSSPTVANVPPDRVPSPEKQDAKVKISGPMNGAPIPSGFKFGGKDPSSTDPAGAASNDRREKAKSRSFWGFGKGNGDKSHLHAAYPPRAVFGVPLEEALDVAQICNLPAIVFRSIQYLEAKKADQEEGIYRLSGSSAVIKSLKDMFNNEGDVDLLASDEYWDPHAIAGLLKSFLRELPSSILTRDLHLKFLAVIDFVDPQERIKELSQLISALPLANYSLLRALTAHLILIVQNSNVNKMTMRNVGIVFSPTLGIPAGVFSLMLGEFNRVFNVDADNDDLGPKEGESALENPSEPFRRNSRQYSDAAADQVLGLAGRTLSTADETQSDGDDFSIQDESGTETTDGIESSSSSSPVSAPGQRDHGVRISEPDTPNTPTAKTSKAASTAASRGLNVAVTHSDRGNRHSRMIGLPSSPRPTTTTHHSPSPPDMLSNTSPTPGTPQ